MDQNCRYDRGAKRNVGGWRQDSNIQQRSMAATTALSMNEGVWLQDGFGCGAASRRVLAAEMSKGAWDIV